MTLVRHPKQLTPDLIRQALPLDDILGVFEDGWSQANVREILERLTGSSVIVLGSEVIVRDGPKMSYTGDNWNYDPVLSLYRSENASRSYARALEYLDRYPDPNDGSILWVLVFDDDSAKL